MNDGGQDGESPLLQQIVARTRELAPLTVVATKTIAMAEDRGSTAMDLAYVISSDQALTAKLLRLSNSAYYGYSRRINNAREAVILLGLRTVRSVAIATSLMDAMRAPELDGFDQNLFWGHSVCVGLSAEIIAKRTRVARPEDAFTAGVLHDLGKLAMLLTEPDRFDEMVGWIADDGALARAAEREAFDGVTHDVVGELLARQWLFPAALAQAIGEHHPPARRDATRTLADVVAAANLSCNRAGLAAGFDWTRDEERRLGHRLPAGAAEALNGVPGGMAAIERKARTFLRHVAGGPPTWFATEVRQEEPPEDEVA